ncbi:MAG: hypothetical protein GY714_27685 [Desulfobacterales bacterium]|nr:hypothetical protein [Desulfobacterales bacterium]MCP4163546.1 hypothetical protein [Deltaproteobacteria bacterium]
MKKTIGIMTNSFIGIWGILLIVSLSAWGAGEISIGFFITFLIAGLIRIIIIRKKKKRKTKYHHPPHKPGIDKHSELYDYHKIMSIRYYNHFR